MYQLSVLIIGAPGTGKSTLLHQLRHYTANKEAVEIIYGYNIREDSFYLEGRESPLLIDGLDEMVS